MILENFINMLMFIAKKDKNEKIIYSMINPKKLTK
jgi:ribosomal protein S7